MPGYKLTNKAVEDLTDIWNYTFEQWSEKQADKYYRMLIDNFDWIVRNTGLGKSYSAVMDNILGFKVGRHIIFYRVLHDNKIEIIRILHEQMDLKNRISEK